MTSLLKGQFIAALLALATAAHANAAALSCTVGPIERTFSASAWNIYACADGKSAVVVPVKVTNGQFGYFVISPKGRGVSVVGEGWGKDSLFQPVFSQLQQLKASDLAAIILAAQSIKPASSPAP